LRRAVESVLRQTHGDFEVVIADDASTDDTGQVAQSFADPRVRYHRQPSNIGVSKNWGAGLALARGEIVSLLMDDDRYEVGFLRAQVAALQAHPTASFAFTGYRVLDEAGHLVKLHTPARSPGAVITGRELLRVALGQECFVGATLYRTAALRAVWPAAEPSGLVVDHAANVWLATQPGAAAVFTGGLDFIHARHAGQLSQTRVDEVFHKTLQLYGDVSKQPLPGWARRLMRHQAAYLHVQRGRAAASRGDRGTAVRRFVDAARLHPLWRGAWTQLARVLMGHRPNIQV
jgi:glycosyltransferase involved in cell wall biosynthesis